MNPAEVQQLASIIGAVLHDVMGLADRETRRPYVYVASASLANDAAIGTTATGSITIDSGTDFICTAVRCSIRQDADGRHPAPMTGSSTATLDGGGIPDPAVLLQIEDGSGDRLWHSQAVDTLAVYGMGSPHDGRLAVPRRLRAGNTTTCTFTTMKLATGGAGWDIRAHFVGFKVPRSV